MTSKRFVYIDDRPDAAVVEALGDENVAVFRFPEDLSNRMDELVPLIHECSVIIVDLKLAEHDADSELLSNKDLYPKDGLALKEILASILTERASLLDANSESAMIDVEPRTTAFVLYSGELDSLGGGAPAKGREHVVAKRIRAEWVLFKRPDARPSSQRDLTILEELAIAVEAVVAVNWSGLQEREALLDAITSLLDLDLTADWATVAKRHIFENRAPLQSLAEDDGVALIRWMLHLVLPYPSLFLDAVEVSVLCRVQPEWGTIQLEEENSAISKLFETSRYNGILSKFLGPRWWRAGVLAALRTATDGSPHDADVLSSRFHSMYDLAVPILRIATPVRTVDEEFRLTTNIVDVEEAVRLEPEEWPAELGPPWIPLVQIAGNPRLRRYVLERDIDRVKSYLLIHDASR